MKDPAAVEIVNADGVSPFVLTCEHASRYTPESYGNLGLGEHDLQRHIAWDIGAANVARRLSALIDAPLFLSGCSRLPLQGFLWWRAANMKFLLMKTVRGFPMPSLLVP